jgi:large subunit ribosomal protein L9
MRLLLLEDVRKLGHVGDVVEVASGYARNYLLPQRLATEPTDENIKAIEDRKREAAAARALRLKRFQDLVTQLEGVSVTIEAAANPEGTLYGGVHEKDIAVALKAQGFPIEPVHVVLDDPIRTLDKRQVTLEFTDDISTQVELWVVREGATPNVEDDESAERDDTADEGDEQPHDDE